MVKNSDVFVFLQVAFIEFYLVDVHPVADVLLVGHWMMNHTWNLLDVGDVQIFSMKLSSLEVDENANFNVAMLLIRLDELDNDIEIGYEWELYEYCILRAVHLVTCNEITLPNSLNVSCKSSILYRRHALQYKCFSSLDSVFIWAIVESKYVSPSDSQYFSIQYTDVIFVVIKYSLIFNFVPCADKTITLKCILDKFLNTIKVRSVFNPEKIATLIWRNILETVQCAFSMKFFVKVHHAGSWGILVEMNKCITTMFAVSPIADQIAFSLILVSIRGLFGRVAACTVSTYNR